MKNGIKLRADSRSKRWSVAKTFGQISPADFPEEFSVKEFRPDYVQHVGDVMCTAITCADIASDKDGVEYDHVELFNRIPHDENGAVPQAALSETVKNGLLPVGQSNRITTFSSYYEPHTGNFDAFDNVRSALLKMKEVNGAAYPVAVYTEWYKEWIGVNDLPVGKTPVSGHMYDIDGWKVINGEVKLVACPWTGTDVYLSRETFNKAVSVWGCGTAVLSTLALDINRRKTILEWLIDAYKNLIIILKEMQYKPISEVIPTIPEVPTPKTNLLADFCDAIAQYEGGPGDLNHRNNNPGNCKTIDGKFMKFTTWNAGMDYLKNYVIRVANGTHPAYPKDPTVSQFFAVYSPSSDNNRPDIYASWVANKIGVKITTHIKDLLS